MKLTMRQMPNPTGVGELLLYSPVGVEEALDHVSRGAVVERAALGAAMAPEEQSVRAAERELRRWVTARARRALGTALLWLLVGPAISLVWLNAAPLLGAVFFWAPPVAIFIATLGGVSGGWLLVALVALAPAFWSWARAWRALRHARHWRRLARAAGSRRLRESPLRRETDPALSIFLDTCGDQIVRMRSLIQVLTEKGSDAAGEAADLARHISMEAARSGLADVAEAYHTLYARLGAGEKSLTRLERVDGGLFAERRATQAARRLRTEVRRQFLPFRPGHRVPGSVGAPMAGLGLGVLAIALAALVTGVYWVPDDGAVIVDTASSRAERALAAFGVGSAPAPQSEVARNPGIHWTWPYPLTSRHAISLEPQRLLLRSRFRQSSADTIDVVDVEISFRIMDVDRWAQQDLDGGGNARLAAQLSQALEAFLQRSRQEARQAVATQTPSLANDAAQIAARADQLVESRLEEVTRVAVSALSGTDAVRNAGVQLGSDHRFRIARNVPESEASALSRG